MKKKFKLLLYLIFTVNFTAIYCDDFLDDFDDSCLNCFDSSCTDLCNNNTDYCCSDFCNDDSCCAFPLDNRHLRKSDACDLCCSCTCYPCGTTIFLPRSQGANTARELIGWQKQLFKPYLCENYAAIAVAAEYTQSFKPERLAQRLFCTDCLTFAGSQVSRNNNTDGYSCPVTNDKFIVADYFGLPVDYKATLFIKPRIENYIVDFNFYFGLNDWSCGFFARLHFPVVHTRWNLGLDECVACKKFRGQDEFPQCYMFSNTSDEQFNGQCQLNVNSGPFHMNNNCTTHTLREALSGNFTFGDMTERWKFGKFNFCANRKTGVADIDVILGYNYATDFGHLALFGQVVVPTGNRPNGKFIFEPIVGNGKHWELGGGFSTHWSLYSDFNNHMYNLGFYLEGNATYMFKTDQIRSFDFCNNGLLSRYILLKEFDVNNRYIGRMINAINFATRNSEVTVGFKLDFSAKLFVKCRGWVLDLGYNIWAKEGEKVCIKTDCPCDIDLRRFGIKGTEGVCCTEHFVANDRIFPEIDTHLLNSTQPNATMFTVIEPTRQIISSTDTEVCLAYNNPEILGPIPISGNTFVIANTNQAPAIVSCRDLDPNSAAQCRMFTHKLFTHWGYIWTYSCYEPHFGIGAEVEFDGSKCHNALNQWGVWIKGGISF